MATDRGAVLAVPAGAAMLLWPAVWNGYPIVFADTGTYLSQAVHLYAGWDRPVFYSVFMLALHWTRTVWPVVMVQALLAAWMLWLSWRVLVPLRAPWGFLALVAFLAAGTWLPWLVSELTPDLLTPLLVLALGLLGWKPDALSRRERLMLMGLATFFITTQQSSVPLSLGIALCVGAAHSVAGLAAARRSERVCGAGRLPFGGYRAADSAATAGRLLAPPALAMLLLSSMNLAVHHRFSLSPFGNVFLLARVIYDGPGMTALRANCPSETWRLCPYRDRLPVNSDDFLWTPGGPLSLAGGAKLVSEDAAAIIAAAVRADPAGQLRASLSNTWTQLLRFESGDGLQPWPDQVSPWVLQDFPPTEGATYQAARQQTGRLAVPGWMTLAHRVIAVAGVSVCAVLLLSTRALPWWRAARRRFGLSPRPKTWGELPPAMAGLVLTILMVLPVSAAITGALSAPHDRYQARLMWLPPFMAVLAVLRARPR